MSSLIASTLHKAVLYHSKTPIEVWDGSTFVPSDVLVNIRAASHQKSFIPFNTMGADKGHPLSGVFSIRDPANQVWNILEHQINTYNNEEYGTTYTITKALHLASLYVEDESVKSASGMSYESPPTELAKVWVDVQHDRYLNTPRPTPRQGMTQVLECYLPLDSGVTKGATLVLSNGMSYKIETVDITTTDAYHCFVTPFGLP